MKLKLQLTFAAVIIFLVLPYTFSKAVGMSGVSDARKETANYPVELDIAYSPDNPPGPSFSDKEKQHQLAEGKRIRDEILAAFRAGKDSYTIPPGDYRFETDLTDSNAGDSLFVLQNLLRDEKRLFRIRGYGATFWFNFSDMPAPSWHRMVKIINCSNISLEGIIIDSDPRGCMDTRVVQIDFDGNRILVEPLAGTRLIKRLPNGQNRFVAFKANGRHIAPLYQVNHDWGPGNHFINGLTITADGQYWLQMKNKNLLNAIRSEIWRKTYGPEGTLEIGDVISILYSTSCAIELEDCKHITLRDCSVYAAKSCLSESGGYGEHQWINCRFMARPGTNNLLGGDGTMNNALMHGSTFDGLVVHRTSDDGFNNHGYWKTVVGTTENSITFKQSLPKLLTRGHKADMFGISSRKFIGTLTVEKVKSKTVTFQEEVGNRFRNAAAMFPEFQNAGWVIRNSFFIDCYQRLLFQCGPGLFENNRIERVGSYLTLERGVIGRIEGGKPDNVTIRNNVFVDSAVCPPVPLVKIDDSSHPLKNIRFEGNLILGSGREVLRTKHIDGLSLRNNIIMNPFRGNVLLPETECLSLPCFRLDHIRGAYVCDNVLVRETGPLDNSAVVCGSSCSNIRQDGNQFLTDPQGDLQSYVRKLTAEHNSDALEIIEKVRTKLNYNSKKSTMKY